MVPVTRYEEVPEQIMTDARPDDTTSAVATARIESPIGEVVLAASPEGLTHVKTTGAQMLMRRPGAREELARAHSDAAARALLEYFSGARRDFGDLVLAARGSSFQHLVWQALRQIPHGQTESYGELAARIGQPGAARAVGLANHQNPIGIVVPCHRVIGADGSLTGFAGGLHRKQWLLGHEGALSLSLFPATSPPPAPAAR
jgi:methylated-DNA-[protein]-cysteine S-methyltransferase